MLRSLHSAASGMLAQETQIDVTANNIANVSTTGFRRARAEFQDLLYQQQRTAGGGTGAPPSGTQIGQGTRIAATQFSHTQGNLMQTGNTLDVAIEGSGFFQIERPDGQTMYSRAGNLQTNAEGQLVTVDGWPLSPAVSIPQGATSLTIAPNGTISVTMPGAAESQAIGRIQLATFPNPGGLEAQGRSLFRANDASGSPIVASPGEEGLGQLSQGFLEGSNVQVVNEMIDLISSQRAYEINHRVIQSADDMLRKAVEV